LVKRFNESGQIVRAVVRNPDRAAALRSMANVEIFPGDLSKPDSLRGCADGCSQVVHCAAKLSGSNRAAFYAINVTGTQALINEAVRARVERFIYASTIGVYGFSEVENITEEFPWPKCNLPYIATKQEAERVVWTAAEQIPVTVARFGDVVGPGQYVWTINLIEKINQGVLKPPTEAASGILNPVYIDNLVDSLLLLSTHPAAPGQAFNVVDGTPIRTSDYIRRLTQMTGKRTFALPAIALKGAAALLMLSDLLRGREASVTPGSINYLLHKATINAEKIRIVLGWTPSINQEEAFRRTEQWLRDEGYLSST
jgi:nucleoside-diphosphate-sugar epimerase